MLSPVWQYCACLSQSSVKETFLHTALLRWTYSFVALIIKMATRGHSVTINTNMGLDNLLWSTDPLSIGFFVDVRWKTWSFFLLMLNSFQTRKDTTEICSVMAYVLWIYYFFVLFCFLSLHVSPLAPRSTCQSHVPPTVAPPIQYCQVGQLVMIRALFSGRCGQF